MKSTNDWDGNELNSEPIRPSAVSPPGPLRDAIRAIWAKSKDTVEARLAVLERAAEAALHGTLDEGLREKAERQAHRLAGSLGTFGFQSASKHARSLEHLFERTPPYDEATAIRACDDVVALRAEVERGLEDDGQAPAPGAPRLVWLVSRDPEMLNRLKPRLSGLGLVVRASAKPAELMAATQSLETDDRPVAVILDAQSSIDADDPESALHNLQLFTELAPTILLCEKLTVDHRVRAAKANVALVLSRTLEPERIVASLRGLLPDEEQLPVTALVIADADNERLTSLRADSRFDCAWVANAPQLLENLATSTPDLVILDAFGRSDAVVLGRLVRMDVHARNVPMAVLLEADGSDAKKIAIELDASLTIVGADDELDRTRLLQEVRRLARTTMAESPGSQPISLARRLEPHAGVVVDEMIASAKRNDRMVALVIVKYTPAGDAGVESRASAVEKVVRALITSQDVCVVEGEGAFVLGLYGAGLEEVRARFGPAVAGLAQELGPEHSVRVGVSVYPGNGESAAALRVQADAALARTTPAFPLLGAAPESPDQAADTADILLIDDDETLAALLVHALTARGYVTRWMEDGVDAKNALLGEHPTLRVRLILLDVNLPSLDGLTLLRRFREDGLLEHSKVIMLTARVRESEVVEALNLGARDHVGKPFSIPILMERIRRTLESAT